MLFLNKYFQYNKSKVQHRCCSLILVSDLRFYGNMIKIQNNQIVELFGQYPIAQQLTKLKTRLGSRL